MKRPVPDSAPRWEEEKQKLPLVLKMILMAFFLCLVVIIIKLSLGYPMLGNFKAPDSVECRDEATPKGPCGHDSHKLVVEDSVALCRCLAESSK